MRDKNDKGKKVNKSYIIGGALVGALVLALIVFAVPWSAVYPPANGTSGVKLTSTFTLIDYRTGEDVSAWVEVSVWTPDSDDLPFDENDAQTLTNFDEEVSSDDADIVAIDLRSYATAWLEIDPDFESDYGGYNTVFNALATRDFRKITGGANYNYIVYVYHAPSNVSINVLERGAMVAGSNIGDASQYNNTFVNGAAGSAFNRGTSGNYTVNLNMPYYSADGWHAGVVGGDEWDIDDEELSDIQAEAAVHDYDFDTEYNWLRDQSNFRTIAPYYDLTDDVNDDFTKDLEKVTNVFGIRFGFNVSVSTADGNRVQVNLTVRARDSNEIPAEIVYDAENIWLMFYEPITCYDKSYNFDIELEFADHIYLGNVTTMRVIVPDDDDNIGAATTLNTMPLIHYLQHGGVA